YDFASGDPPAENAARFLADVAPSPHTLCCLDYEKSATHSQMTAAQARTFMEAVDQKIGRACWIYGGNWVAENISVQRMSSADVDWWRMHPLWLCQYKTGVQPATYGDLLRMLRIPRPWSAPTLVQYTGDGVGPPPHTVPGLERGADLNVFG